MPPTRDERRSPIEPSTPVASSRLDASDAAISAMSAEGRELFELMQKHDELRCLSSRFADKLAGESMSSGQSIASMCTAITDAATELAARLEGSADIATAERASLVRRYVAQARRRPSHEQDTRPSVERTQHQEDRAQSPEDARAMYPTVDMTKAVLVPPEKRVPAGQVQALLDTLVANAGRGGTPSSPTPSSTTPSSPTPSARTSRSGDAFST